MSCCLIFFSMHSWHALAARGRDKVFPHKSLAVHLSRLRNLCSVQEGTHSLLGLWLPKLVTWRLFSYGNLQQHCSLIISWQPGVVIPTWHAAAKTPSTILHLMLLWSETREYQQLLPVIIFHWTRSGDCIQKSQEHCTFKTWRHSHAVKTGNLSDQYLRGPDH